MVIMRGMPGSGKSYLSKLILDRSYKEPNYKQHIFSADDFFMINGMYQYNVEKLEEAHRFCQNHALTKAREGYSPIVIDNTNLQHWEMYPYVKIAVDNGYVINILEPNTPWRNNANSLFKKNTHNIPEIKLRRMIEKYEPLNNIEDILRPLKLEQYLTTKPKIRHYPMVEDMLVDAQNAGDSESFAFESLSRDDDGRIDEGDIFTTSRGNNEKAHWYYGKELCGEKSTKILPQSNVQNIMLPKPPRLAGNANRNPFWSDIPTSSTTLSDVVDVEPKDNWSTDFKTTDWTPYESESQGFWKANTEVKNTTPAKPKPKRKVSFYCG
jgi:predicted kinase